MSGLGTLSYTHFINVKSKVYSLKLFALSRSIKRAITPLAMIAIVFLSNDCDTGASTDEKQKRNDYIKTKSILKSRLYIINPVPIQQKILAELKFGWFMFKRWLWHSVVFGPEKSSKPAFIRSSIWGVMKSIVLFCLKTIALQIIVFMPRIKIV